MATPNVQLEPIALLEIVSFHHAAGRKIQPDTTVGFVIGSREAQDVVVFGSSPIILGTDSLDMSAAEAKTLTTERLQMMLKNKHFFQGRRRQPQVVGWYFSGPPTPTAALAKLQSELWPLAVAAVTFPEANGDNDHITHIKDVCVSCAPIEAAMCFCIDSTNRFQASVVQVTSSGSCTVLPLQPKQEQVQASVILEPPLKLSDPLPAHLSLLAESIQVLAQKVALVSQQIEQQVTGAAPCSRTLRRRAATLTQQLQRLHHMNFSHQLQDVTANVDAARTLQALFSSTAQLQKLMAVTSLRSGE